jgi:hypothetical protein
MSYEIKFDDLPGGYSLTSARKGNNVTVALREFTSSEDGNLFIGRLEGFPSQVIGMLPPTLGIRPSMVDHLLAIIRRDKTATVYLNEIPIIAEFLIKGRDLEPGQAVFADDIADIRRVTFKDIEVPNDAGVVFLFSQSWRKGFFYDFAPLAGEEPKLRNYDLGALFAQYYSYLSFQNIFQINEDEWNRIIAQGWFPFISLTRSTIKEIISYARNEWEIDDLAERIAVEVKELIPSFLVKWEKNNLFAQHFEVLKQATERFLANDYISANSIIYPRIEGIMRTHHLMTSQEVKPTQSNLVSAVVRSRAEERHAHSMLLPNNFLRYMREVYFANFDTKSPNILSRHSIAHGVVSAETLSLKGAVIGLLILDQLSLFLGGKGNSVG